MRLRPSPGRRPRIPRPHRASIGNSRDVRVGASPASDGNAHSWERARKSEPIAGGVLAYILPVRLSCRHVASQSGLLLCPRDLHSLATPRSSSENRKPPSRFRSATESSGVLLVSERSHAIRYRRSIAVLVYLETKPPEDSPSLAGYASLAAIFRPFGTIFFALLNREEPAVSCPPDFLDDIEASVNAAVDPAANLHATQRVNLRVTQLWLRMSSGS